MHILLLPRTMGRVYMKEEEEVMISKTELKPSKRISEKIKQDAIRVPVRDGKIILDSKNPLHRMLMEENEES